MKTLTDYIVRYWYCHGEGKNLHIIELYQTYNKETGLRGSPLHSFESSRISDLIKNSKSFLTKNQIIEIKSVAKNGHESIISTEGKFL